MPGTERPAIPVLVAISQATSRQEITALLEGMSPPLEIVTADNGQQALRLCLQREFAMLLLDTKMPDMDGYRIAELLQANPATRTLAIIFVSPDSDVPLFHGDESCPTDYLPQPLIPRQLLNKVRLYGKLYQQQQELKRYEEWRALEAVRSNTLLQQSETRLQDAELLARLGHFQFDGQQLLCSTALQRLLGAPPQLSLPHIREALTPHDWRALLKAVTMLKHHAANIEQALRYRLADGRTLDLMLIMRRQGTAGGAVFEGVLQDISTHKETERALQALSHKLEQHVAERGRQLEQAQAKVSENQYLQALTHLVAGIAHELNTPLGNIILAATTQRTHLAELQQQLSCEKASRSLLRSRTQSAQEASALIEASAQRAADLITDFKAIALADFQESPIHFDLQGIANEVFALLQKPLEKAGVRWNNRIPASIVLHSHPQAMQHILRQLTENALLHAFSGTEAPQITLQAVTAGDTLELFFQDNGCGVENDTHQKLFEPFYTTRMGQGCAGLGLPLVHNLVRKALHGQISVTAATPHGLQFRLSCPLRLGNGQ